jgi:hypothetical protein
MSELFSVYKNNFEKNLEKIKDSMAKVEEANNSQDKTPENSFITETYNLINEGEKIVKQMQIEISSLNGSDEYNEYSDKIRDFQFTMYQLKRKLKKLEDTFKDKISNSLFENNDSNLKNGLIANEVLAYQGKQKIEEAKRTLYNIEDNGKQALNSLEKQTNSMKAVNVKIAGMNDDLENSNNLLNKMKIRYQRNKRQIFIFGIILILIIALIIVWKILFK